jgi:hypothetical protein
MQLAFQFAGIEIAEFKPGLWSMPGLGLLEYLREDCSTVSVPVQRGKYHAWDLYRHSYEPRFVGFQFWLWYDPQRLLPAPPVHP